jgi:hypothetical protein
MVPKRLSVKLFAANPEVVDASAFMPVFQRWIQRKSVEGLLIDVADYKHVPDGPGMVLIGHEGDYSYSYADGRPGLLYVRKVAFGGDLAASVAAACRLALLAAQLLEAEKKLGGLKFNYDEAQIGLLDRLKTPNTPEEWTSVKAELEPSLAALYGDTPIELISVREDPREALTVGLSASGPVSAADLLDRLAKIVGVTEQIS